MEVSRKEQLSVKINFPALKEQTQWMLEEEIPLCLKLATVETSSIITRPAKSFHSRETHNQLDIGTRQIGKHKP